MLTMNVTIESLIAEQQQAIQRQSLRHAWHSAELTHCRQRQRSGQKLHSGWQSWPGSKLISFLSRAFGVRTGPDVQPQMRTR